MNSIKLVLAATLIATTMNAQNAPQLRPDNIDEVLAAMTLEEKAKLLVGGANNFFSSTAVVGGEARLVAGAAGTTAEIPRLGIPATVLTDGPAGVRIDPIREGDSHTYYATGFPIGSCLAATWNTSLVCEVGAAIGNETKEYRCDVLLGPGMNLHRNPLCGRNFEYYSEDPLVTGKIAAAYIKGVQSQGVGVSAKHYAINSQETERTSVDEQVSARASRELYLKGFEIAVRESDPWTVMASYNKVNGIFAQGSHDLLTKVLRDDWGFKGIVMTDWIGIRKGLRTIDEVKAGDDLLEPGQPEQIKEIVEGVRSGQLNIADVDRNVRRLLEYIVKTPSFHKYPASNSPDFKAHAAITRQSANEGIVLLKNNGTLPWNTDGQKVKTVALFGENSYEFLSGGTGSGCVHTPYVVDMVEGLKNAGIESSATLTDLYRKYIEFAKAKFQAERHPARWYQMEMFGQQKYPEISISPICINNEVKTADAAIVTIGRQAGEGVDREIEGEFNLTADERQMIVDVCNAFHAEGKPVVVVINSGSVIETSSWSGYPDAIICAWQPGEEGGNSVADILTGKVCPSGRLTMTWPIAIADHPSTKNFPGTMDFYSFQVSRDNGPIPNYDFTKHEEGIYVGYRHFDTRGCEVAYPFGFGLSYTTFEFSKPTVTQKGDRIEVSVVVRNTGKVAGKEVAQVYVAAPKGKLDKPAKELKAFGKTRELKPGESETLKMTLSHRDLASYDEEQNAWVVDAGNYDFQIGANVSDIRVSTRLQVKALIEPTSKIF